MRSKIRSPRPARRATDASRARRGAKALIECYTELARTQAHLLAPILHGAAPVQWEHYPADDAIDRAGVYQWFYHSHSPADRPDSTEHGHFHLFARVAGTGGLVESQRERDFLASLAANASDTATRHLLCIGLNASGVPVSLFTVNSWVTGDLPLSAAGTMSLLESMRLDTGHPIIDALIVGLLQLYGSDVRSLLAERDERLRRRAATGSGTLDDAGIEILSSLPLHVDDAVDRVLAKQRRPRPRKRQSPPES